MNFFGNKLTKRQVFIGVAVLVGISALGALQWGKFGEGAVAAGDGSDGVGAAVVKPLPVNVAKLERVTSFVRQRSFTGTVRARNRSDLAFELGGKIDQVFFDEGDSVKAGQVVATLNTDQLVAQRNAANANLKQANSVLAELQAGPRSERIETAKANLAAAQSEFQRALTNLKRRKNLRNGGAISFEEYDQARYTEQTAKANVRSAEQQLAELVAGTRHEKILAQEAVVSQIEASVAEIDVAIDKSQLIAPFSGTVTRRMLDPGTIAPGSLPVMRLVEGEYLEAWIGLPVEIVNNMELGEEHLVMMNGQSCAATLRAKIPELDPVTRTQMVVLKLGNTANTMAVAGQLCEVKVETLVESEGYWIPNTALSKGVRGLWSVMVVEGSDEEGFLTSIRDIEVVNTEEGRVLARGTISEDELVVVDGVHRITSGQLVSPLDQEELSLRQ